MEITDAGNVDGALDILADLESAPKRPNGQPCRIAVMRRDRPDLVPQWTRAINARRAGAGITHDEIAGWFTRHNFRMTRNVPERHAKSALVCQWCQPGREITA